MDHIIFEHIRKFDKKDWKSFKTFVSSPYFNKNKRIVQYVEFLALNPSLNDKNALFRAAFPERKHYNDSSLRSIHSEILQLILKFYQIEKLNDSDKATSLDILVQKDQFRTYQLIKNRWLKRSENGLQDEKFFRSKLEMSKIHYEFLSRKEQRKSEVLDQALLDVNYNLDQLYLVEKLQLLAEMQNRGISENESITLLELKTILNKPINRNNQFIQIFTEILTLLSDHAEKSFFGVYELIKKENQKFSKKELKDMFEYIQNFCIRKINQ
ncbi:MAG: hypothetical protein MRY83_19790 [Flavobacteriales bacterium]|nr:hypothetical protein [Flavobacteriales bacterium]